MTKHKNAHKHARPYYHRKDGRNYRAINTGGPYSPLDIKNAYGISSKYTGKGTTIGIIELGGEYYPSDLQKLLSDLNITQTGSVTNVLVDGATMSPDPNGADVEVMLDVEIIAAIANGAAVRVYFAPNTDQGFIDALAQAVKECDVVSISWGAEEANWSPASRASFDAVLQSAIQNNVYVFVAAGDNGSSDGGSGNNVDYPGSSPYSISCGGTNLVLSNGVIESETVWNDGSAGGASGGGFSSVYSQPDYQKSVVTSPYRAEPDVAGVADPNTGWNIVSGGQYIVVGGTSAVAPLWAALYACAMEAYGVRIVNLQNLLYSNISKFNDIVSGSNGSYDAGPGYDECTGLGTPSAALFNVLAAALPPVSPPPPPPVSPPPVSPPPPPPVNPPSKPGKAKWLAELDGNMNIIKKTKWKSIFSIFFN